MREAALVLPRDAGTSAEQRRAEVLLAAVHGVFSAAEEGHGRMAPEELDQLRVVVAAARAHRLWAYHSANSDVPAPKAVPKKTWSGNPHVHGLEPPELG